MQFVIIVICCQARLDGGFIFRPYLTTLLEGNIFVLHKRIFSFSKYYFLVCLPLTRRCGLIRRFVVERKTNFANSLPIASDLSLGVTFAKPSSL